MKITREGLLKYCRRRIGELDAGQLAKVADTLGKPHITVWCQYSFEDKHFSTEFHAAKKVAPKK